MRSPDAMTAPTRNTPAPGWPRAVLFDLDGTLVDSARVIAEILNELRQERGASALDLATVQPWISLGAAQLVANALGGDAQSNAADVAEFRARYAARLTPPGSLYAGMREALDALRDAGVVLAVCSNKPQRLCEKVLRELRLDDRFADVCGGDAGHAKPDPRHVTSILARLGVAPDAAVLVGDSELDALAAAASGVGFVFASYGYGTLPAAAAPVTAARPGEIPDAVRAAAPATRGKP
jgi:phosphoglycolate phosphatase